jgi:hypothetical protein
LFVVKPLLAQAEQKAAARSWLVVATKQYKGFESITKINSLQNKCNKFFSFFSFVVLNRFMKCISFVGFASAIARLI